MSICSWMSSIVSSISSLESPSSGFSKLSRRQPEQESIIAHQGALSSQFNTGQESLSLCSANRCQEASERFLISRSSKTSSFSPTRVFDTQPRFLNSLKGPQSTPFLNVYQPFLVSSPNSGPLQSCSFSDHHKIKDPPKPGLTLQKITSSSCLLDCPNFCRRIK